MDEGRGRLERKRGRRPEAGKGGEGEEGIEDERRVGFPDIAGLSSMGTERKEEQHLSSSGPIVSRTQPEAHSQADGPYTSA